ncbi:NAD(P)/FAD-dependent oxidoreductase [Rhizosaccharibacter radicis]|uniref:FAD-binding oxidoreductase n=1 Tax=Rhizosaccharibacter radicis TaxID=2782605 RepID=A0ABT1W1J9_9PROT|nr:FAD-binding oxidoreductase [Acetobacteraceae bacterium KSS12]
MIVYDMQAAGTSDQTVTGDRLQAEVVVVGGGIVGRTAAFLLRARKRDVLLLDDGAADDDVPPVGFGHDWVGPASWGNAGHIATEQVRPLAGTSFLLSAPKRLFVLGGALDLGWRRPGAWLPWAGRMVRACRDAEAGTRVLSALLSDAMPAWHRLGLALGMPDMVREDGHLMLWHDPAACRTGMAAWRAAPTGTAGIETLDGAALREVAARLACPPAGGLRMTGTGQVADPVLAMRALRRAFLEAGGRVLGARVRTLLPSGQDNALALEDGRVVRAGQILLAAGVGTATMLRGAGVRMPMVAERGYHLEWRHGADWPLPPLVFEERSLIVSRFGDRLRASSFVEFDRENAAPDPRKWRRLEDHVRALGLPVASGFRRWMGARPTLPDYLPAIGRSAALPDLWVAAGHQHLGLTLAPRTAEILCALMTSPEGHPGAAVPMPAPEVMAAIGPDRFGRRAMTGAPGWPRAARDEAPAPPGDILASRETFASPVPDESADHA